MKKYFVVALLCLVSCQSAPKQESTTPQKLAAREQVEAHGKKWIVSTQGRVATEAAAKILKQGGNLMDAAIAASFAISVERPHSTGIGGGGFLIYYQAKTKTAHVIDFRERAPSKASSNMFLDKAGQVIPDRSQLGGAAVGVPGFIRGMSYLHKKWGKLKWKNLIEPAVLAAEQGFPIYRTLGLALKEEEKKLKQFAVGEYPFVVEANSFKQPQLARTLRILSKNSEDFYTGKIAKNIISAAKRTGGVITENDLFTYRVIERAPLKTQYKDLELISMPPPSSGGLHVMQILKMLEQDDLKKLGQLSSQAVHLESQAMQFAFADRSKYLGDPDFVEVPIHKLLDPTYLKQRRSLFTPLLAQKSASIAPGEIMLSQESSETTHLSLMDHEGNVIVSTQSVNGWFGSHVAVDGIILNNTMDDFSAKPGAQNMFGAIGADANRIESRKRPLSSMSPTIVLKNGKPVLALGAPGGTRIITAVAQTILNVVEFQNDLYTAIRAPRIHHQWIPDELWIEDHADRPDLFKDLEKRGYTLKKITPKSNVMAVGVDQNGLVGVSDPRDNGTSQGE